MTSAASMPRQEAAALLGVPVDASAADVQRAYLRAARRTHPDVLPEADEAGRRAAGEAFDRLTRARDALASRGLPMEAPPVLPTPAGPTLNGARRNRGLGGSLVVLVLLAFLLVAIVSGEQALLGDPLQVPVSSTAP